MTPGVGVKYGGGVGGSVPFCGQCKSMVYPQDGKLVCKKCGWTSAGPAVSNVLRSEASG